VQAGKVLGEPPAEGFLDRDPLLWLGRHSAVNGPELTRRSEALNRWQIVGRGGGCGRADRRPGP